MCDASCGRAGVPDSQVTVAQISALSLQALRPLSGMPCKSSAPPFTLYRDDVTVLEGGYEVDDEAKDR